MTTREVIYVNGCSFTAGCDIADELQEGCPDYISLNHALKTLGEKEAQDMARKYFDWKQSLSMDVNLSLIPYEQQRRWTTVLSNIIETSVVNASVPGTDNQSIVIRTCNDITKLQAQGHNIKKIIIQFTCRTRVSYVKSWYSSSDLTFKTDRGRKEQITLDDEFYIRSLNHGIIDTNLLNPYENAFLKSYNPIILYEGQPEGSDFLNYLLQLKIYKNAIKGATGIDPLFVDSWFLKIFGYQRIENDERLYNSSLSDSSIINRTIAEVFPQGFSSMVDVCDREDFVITQGYHFNALAHKKFAEHLAERYFK